MSLAYLILCVHTADTKRYKHLVWTHCSHFVCADSPKQLKLKIIDLKEIFSMIEVMLLFCITLLFYIHIIFFPSLLSR